MQNMFPGEVNNLYPARPINLRCPFCHQLGTFAAIANVNDVAWGVESFVETKGIQQIPHRAGMRQCPNIKCRTLVFIHTLNEDMTEMECFPPEIIDFDASSIPEQIVSSIQEAIVCHASGAYKASALMVRRSLEELCADQGVLGQNLKERPAALGKVVVIPRELLESSDDLRLLGNDAAHLEAKTYNSIGKEEVELAIDLAKELLKSVYQYTALVKRLKDLKKQTA